MDCEKGFRVQGTAVRVQRPRLPLMVNIATMQLEHVLGRHTIITVAGGVK